MIVMSKYYLAYGSNLNVRQMQYRCPTARIVGISVIKNYELLYKGSKTGAYLTIEKKKGSLVPVAVWEVSDEDESRLDIYEGFPDFYYKKNIRLPVKLLRNSKTKELDAFVYIMHEERKLGVPTTAYIRTCEEGYGFFRFDTAFLDKAYNKSARGAK
jgi:hypothetical protein